MSMIIWIQICTASWTVTTEIYKNNSFHIIHESVLHTKGTLQGTIDIMFSLSLHPFALYRVHVIFVVVCIYLFMSMMSDSNMTGITT